MSIAFILLTLVFLAVSVAMILLILVQRPQGGGLAGAFGGAGGGGTDTAFGGRTGDALTLATVGAFALFLSLGIIINIIGNPRATAAEPSTDTGLVDPDVSDRRDDRPVSVIPVDGTGEPSGRGLSVGELQLIGEIVPETVETTGEPDGEPGGEPGGEPDGEPRGESQPDAESTDAPRE